MIDYNEFKGKGIPKFPKDARVAFLGDSLTAGSLWTEAIFEYYLKHFPEDNIRMYSVGVGGGTAAFALEHLDEDIMLFEPTHVVVMFSVNDIGGYEGNPIERANKFHDDMKKLTDALIERGMTVYYMCPPASSLHDGWDVQPREIAHMVMKSLAAEYNSYCCDLYGMMSPLTGNAEIMLPDLTHFTAIGDSVIARLFLHSQGFDGFSPDEENFYDRIILNYDVDHRKIFNDKIRNIWCTIRNISTIGDTVEAKVNRLKERIKTRANGAWDDFCYYRAVDFIELYPNLDFYLEMVKSDTEMLLEKAK
ncbi:MAG: hypothetical protein IKZ03_04775, partial [Clostridia bacterium]|nr:hypothetical protein [Clostridia bacterium]